MLKRIIILILLAAVGFGGYKYYQQRLATEQDTDELILYGNVDIRQVDLAFKDSERIQSVYVEEGDKVIKGQLLAELETRRLRASIEATRASVQAQDFKVQELVNGPREEELKAAIADQDQAEAERVVAERTYKRQARLLRSGSTTQQDVDDARSQYDVAVAKLKAASENRILLEKGTRWEEIRQGESTLKSQQAQLNALLVELDESKLRAPTDAIVRNRNLEPGDMASAQKPVFTLAVNDPKWVRAYVSEAELGWLKPGQKGYASVDSRPDKQYEGWVGFISSVAEFTPRAVETPELRTSLVYEVRLNVHDPDNELRLGMPSTVHINIPERTAAKKKAKAEK